MELNWQNAGGKLPEGWTVVPLRDFLVNEKSVSVGVMYPGKHDENGVPLIKVGDVKNGKVEGTPESRISLAVDEEYKRTRLSGDELLITLVGNPGECVIVQPHMKGWNAARALAVLRLKDPDTRRWLNMVLQSRPLKHIIDSRLNTTVQKTLNLKDVKELPIPIPNNGTDTLCRYYYDLDQKITLNHQINQTLEQMAQTLFKSWFVDFDPVIDNALDAGNPIPDELQHRAEARKAVRQGRAAADKEREGFKPQPDDVRQLFPDAFEESELGWVPKGWVYQSFGSLLASTIGGDWGKDVQDEKHTVQSRIVRGTDIPDLISGQLSSAPLRWVEPKKLKSRQIERGDIIIEVSGGSPKQPTGRSIFMTDSMLDRLGSIIEPASFCRRFKPSSFNIGLLASLHLQKIYADGKTWEYQNQSTGIANFQTKFFLEAEMVLIPSEPVLEAFCRIVTPLVEKSQNNEQIALAKLRDTLLPKLISGELRLDDVEAVVEQETVSA